MLTARTRYNDSTACVFQISIIRRVCEVSLKSEHLVHIKSPMHTSKCRFDLVTNIRPNGSNATTPNSKVEILLKVNWVIWEILQQNSVHCSFTKCRLTSYHSTLC